MDGLTTVQDLLKSIVAPQGISKTIDAKDYEKAFNDIDIDGDGCLTIEELKRLFEAHGQIYSEEELGKMVAGVDKNFNGTIEMEEFLELIKTYISSKEVDKEDMVAAFKLFDRNRRGYVSVSTLKFLLTKVGPAPLTDNVNELLKFADIKGDGKVYYEDVVKRVFEKESGSN